MTKESEDAAKWSIIEKYQETSKRLVVLGQRCEEIGRAINVLGHAISDHPETVTITQDNVTYPKYAGYPAFERNREEMSTLSVADYNPDSLKALVDDYREALRVKMDCLEKLHTLGVSMEAVAK